MKSDLKTLSDFILDPTEIERSRKAWKWEFIGLCRCPINNPVEYATHTKENCPLHGGGK